MVEVALLAIKDLSLLMSSALVLILVCLLIARPQQSALRHVYLFCLVLFFLVGLVRMLASLLHWDIAIDAALLLVVNNILFMVGCVFFLFGPRLLGRHKKMAINHDDRVRADFFSPFRANARPFFIHDNPAQQQSEQLGQVQDAQSLASEVLVEVQPQLAEKLTEFMLLQKPYLEPHITVERLAIKLNVSPKLLSGTINNELQMNFFELISNYRVLEAKKRLADPTLQDKPICEIMKSCGFNSKSVFNQAFKKAVGVTPSIYRQQHCR
ncbi:hypothetical protein O59_000875 [Cellvibrio sp. BR]|jgi:AraC-like DNA-binding protein|uniref:helix-turn-helix domain-containing protein n=1 Tax=unclassified Cellvibrio TaxID=2624793 RepID=UPI0002601724|nr:MULTISPECIES: helix-turn-helix domain-containing protein [unclassified Cellvibrio]EIK46854.1 hypothetical protein O59_000875 [Cellvibrio sp. BR]QEY11163.1 AraC family transcriptional regulator [Cellvibrio sp. KY-YJ-3]UUA71254.1 helix-turn-helix domain-containing protein [Cellvibrio sp. QJXJ]